MPMLYDKASISGAARITREGFLVADALVAQAGNIQDYYARELGLTDRQPNEVVRVYRPESEVFAVDSLRSASRLPITLDHPVKDGQGVMVDAKNWAEFAKGETGEDILRDGQFIRVPLRVTDAKAVASVQADRQEFSLGYACDVKFEAGVTDSGQAYDATATNIRYNHLAACRTARGGPELRIVDERERVSAADSVTAAKSWLEKAIALHEKHMSGDAPTTGPAGEKSQMLMMTQMQNALDELDDETDTGTMGDAKKKKRRSMSGMKMGDTIMPFVLIDGVPVDTSNAEIADTAIRNLLTARDTAVTSLGDAMRTVGERDATIAAKDAEIVTLKDQVASAQRNAPALAASYARVVDQAKRLGATVTDAMDEPAVIAATVRHKLGDKAATYGPEQNAAAFAVLVDSLPVNDGNRAPVNDALANVLGHQPVNIGDAATQAATARDARFARFGSAHMGVTKPAAAAA